MKGIADVFFSGFDSDGQFVLRSHFSVFGTDAGHVDGQSPFFMAGIILNDFQRYKIADIF